MIKKRLAPIRWLAEKGFTLIELLVVISIIGILAGLTLSSYSGAQKQARDTQRKSDLVRMQTALEAYYASNNAYPVSSGWWGECASFGSHPRSGANGYIPNIAPMFIEELPRDPRVQTSSTSCYLYYSNGADYKLLAHGTPETGYPATSPFYDPVRPTWAWQVHSSDASKGW